MLVGMTNRPMSHRADRAAIREAGRRASSSGSAGG
jgi:hypothetical protein